MKRAAWWLLSVIVFTPSTTKASGFEVGDLSATAAGTGGAATARDGDPAAAFYNPAALADGRGIRLGLGVTLAMPRIEAGSLDGTWAATTDRAVSSPPHLYASYAHRAWAVSLSVNVPFGSRVRWPTDWAGRFETVRSNLTVVRIAPAIAYRVGPLRMAVGPHLDAGVFRIRRNLDFVDTEGDVDIRLHGVGLGGHASLFYAPNSRVQLGLTYRSRTRLRMNGEADFTSPDEFTGRLPDQAARSEFMLPDRITVGVQANVASIRILGDVGLVLWSTNDEVRIRFAEDNTADAVQRTNLRNAVSVRFGVEWDPTAGWTVRAGGLVEPSPVPASSLTPTSPDSLRLGMALGASHQLNDRLSLDAFYGFLALIGRESTSRDAPAAHYRAHAHVLGVGMRCSWDPSATEELADLTD